MLLNFKNDVPSFLNGKACYFNYMGKKVIFFWRLANILIHVQKTFLESTKNYIDMRVSQVTDDEVLQTGFIYLREF